MRKTPISGKDFISDLMSRGVYTFSTEQAQKAFGTSARTTIALLYRLKKRGFIAVPFRGFHVIVPPEYRSFGCLPAVQFIPSLMDHLNSPYYVGLLSAGEFHGAAHQKPQYFQVIVPKHRAPIECGRVRVFFATRQNLLKMPTETRNTPRGVVRISSPEGTAFDLVTYPEHSAGLSNVATVLLELSERMQPELLLKAAKKASAIPYVQRLGYLLEFLKLRKFSGPLADYVAKHATVFTPLVPGLPKDGMPKNAKWKLIVNSEVEPDL